jgi:hypothetical protein
MRCPLCRGWVGLQAATCACGFDLVSGGVGPAIRHARADIKKAAAHLLVGFGAGGALVGWFVVAGPFRPFMSMRLLIVTALAAIYGIGRGTWLLFDARRRLAVAERMRTPAAARVVRVGRSPGG